MGKYLDLKKHICLCGGIMEYDGIETVGIKDDSGEERVEDLDVYICPKCDYKIWILAPQYSKHLELLEELRESVKDVLEKYRVPAKRARCVKSQNSK